MGESAGSPPRSPHVLVLNDAPEILELFAEILQEEGYRVSESTQPPDLDSLKQLRPDLIVQDLMDGQTSGEGWRFLTMARTDPIISRIPLILCTSWTSVVRDDAVAEELRRLGVPVVTMPFALDDLLGIMDAALSESRSGSE